MISTPTLFNELTAEQAGDQRYRRPFTGLDHSKSFAFSKKRSIAYNEQAVGEHGLNAKLFAAIRSDMLEVPYMSDFLLTANDTPFATLEGVNAVTGD